MDWLKLFRRKPKVTEPLSVVPKRGKKLASALYKAQQTVTPVYPIKVPELPPGVVPPGAKSGIAMDTYSTTFPPQFFGGDMVGFPGYPHLSFLSTRAEYRAMASALSTELTREWITLNSSETAGEGTKKKVTELTKKLQDIGLQQVIQRAVEHDAYFGRAQILIDIQGHDLSTPLVLSPKTIKPKSFNKITTVEAIWTTPLAYNALDPSSPNFYKPESWYMLGKPVHASRLMTVITRPLADMLKPAFNFGGMSLSQLAEPSIDNWLRTRHSVSNLISNFSITALATSMDQVLQGNDDGDDLVMRAKLFAATRDNQGLMLLDKEREDLVQVNVPLSGLHELQAQSQEQMCSVSHTPSTVLLGVAPSGFGNVAEGEMEAWQKWVGGQQGAYWRTPIDTILKVLQLSMYGEIDPDITFAFNPLFQMTPKELSEIQKSEADRATAYIQGGVIDPSEERERLARDPDSGYQGLDLSLVITDPNTGDSDNENE